MGWEGEFYFLGFEAFLYLEVDALVDLLTKPVIRGHDPVSHINIQSPVIEVTEIDPWWEVVVGVYFWSIG